MTPEQREKLLTTREWHELCDDTMKVIADLELGFGKEHVAYRRGSNLLLRLFQVLDDAYQALNLPPDHGKNGASDAEARPGQAHTADR